MKTMILSVVITLTAACTFHFNAVAQNDLGINEEDMIDYSRPLVIADIQTGTDKSVDAAATSFSLNKNEIKRNERAAAILQKNFSGAVNVNWYKVTSCIVASFNKDAIKTKVYFDSKGRMLYSIKYYEEKIMPQEVRHTVKSIYYDYSIINVTEVNTTMADMQTTYVVLAQDTENIKTLIVRGNEIVSVETCRKA